MRKAGKRIWVWILSGLALLIGFNSCEPSTLYVPPPEVLYGPPTEDTIRN